MSMMLIMEASDAIFRDIEDALGEDMWVGRAKNFDEASKFFAGNPDIGLLAINAQYFEEPNSERMIGKIRESYRYPILCYAEKERDRKKLTKKGIATHQTSVLDVARYSKILLDVS